MGIFTWSQVEGSTGVGTKRIFIIAMEQYNDDYEKLRYMQNGRKGFPHLKGKKGKGRSSSKRNLLSFSKGNPFSFSEYFLDVSVENWGFK